MKCNCKKAFLVFFAVILSVTLEGQGTLSTADSIAVKGLKVEARDQGGSQERAGTDKEKQQRSKDKKTAQEKNNSQGAKEVKSSRPDMSKARGARPQSIERPSGSRIPKGVGRPRGAPGPGRR